MHTFGKGSLVLAMAGAVVRAPYQASCCFADAVRSRLKWRSAELVVFWALLLEGTCAERW
jgi:hypothetical protein